MEKKGFFQSRLSSLLIIVVVSAAVFFVSKYYTNPGEKPLANDLITPVAMDPIDSSSCVACHTDAGIIASMAVMDEDDAHGAEGG